MSQADWRPFRPRQMWLGVPTWGAQLDSERDTPVQKKFNI